MGKNDGRGEKVMAQGREHNHQGERDGKGERAMTQRRKHVMSRENEVPKLDRLATMRL
jgi:hypothetical protein